MCDHNSTQRAWKDEVEVIALQPENGNADKSENVVESPNKEITQETTFIIESPGKVSRETYVLDSPSKLSHETYNIDSPTKLSQGTYNVESPAKLSSASLSNKKSGQASPQSAGGEVLQIETEEIKPVDIRHEIKKDLKDHLSLSSRRQSVGNWSVDSGRSLTSQSQSDTRSYRERLRERLQNVKERTGTSVTSSQSKVRQRIKQKSPAISKFDDYFRKEEEEISAALEKHQQLRVTWQQADSVTSEAEAAYDFFTKVWKDDAEELPSEQHMSSPPAEMESEEQTKLLASQFLGLPDEGPPLVDNYVPPLIEDQNKRRELEEQLLFYPTYDYVPVEDKLGGKTARRLEEEGLFVGNPPKIPDQWKNRLEQRIVFAGEKQWFAEDGRLKCLSDPLLEKAFHPPLFNAKLNSSLKPQYKPAELMDMSKKKRSVEEIPDDKTCLLELEIDELRFTHHPLFSREHVLSQQLISLYDAYRDRMESEIGVRLAQHLQALRHARDNLLCIIDSDPSHVEKLQRYIAEISETKELRLSEGIKDRELTTSVLKTWHDLKKIRQQQGFSSTTTQLLIFTPENEESPFNLPDEWENEIQNQLKEYQLENDEELKKSKFNKNISNIKEKLVKSMESGRGDAEKLKLQLMELISRSIRPPDEPPVILQLTETGCDGEVKDSTEVQRRTAVKRCQVSLRVLYNEQEVCQTMLKHIDEHFIARFNQHFAIRILHWPKSLTVEVLSDGKRSLARVFIPIPSSTTTIDTSQFEQLEFSSARVARPIGIGAVGAGVPFSIFPGGSQICFHTGGIITYKTGWAQEDDHILSPPEENIPSVKKRNNFPSIFSALKEAGRLQEWAEKTYLDPNDPSNAPFFESLQEAVNKEETKTEEFHLNPLQAEFEFCSDEDLKNNPRLKLLRLRDQAAPEFRGLRNIPLREREIPPDIFKIYEERISASSTLTVPHSVGESSLEAHRNWGQHFLSRVRDNLVRRCRQAQHQRALRDIVIEDQVPDMGTLGLTFMKWFQPKRPLRPTRKERTKVPVKSLAGQEVKIIINVVRAFEVPIRADVDTMSLENGIAMVPVRPFVEISFQDYRCRTTTAEGANPTWNQDLHIPLRAPHGDMTPGGLQAIKDNLYCHLYDETIIDLLEDDRQRATNIHQRLERHWLGSLAIPFASLYANSRVEGTFKLYSPPVLLGYERDGQHKTASSGAAATSSSSSHLRNNTFLTLFITVHPPLHLPEPFKERLECSESPQLEQHMEEWEAQVTKEFPGRSVKTTVMDVNGKSVCVTRFFRPLDPPVIDEGVVTTPEMAAWFVSKIPLTPGSVLFPGLFDVWLTADQVLKVLQGDCDDHGVLLCCFFLRLGLKAWLVLGIGIPHGRSSFVLTQQEEEMHVWDPASGQKYSLTDSFCPLHKVHCLINDENVWVNIQKDDAIRRVKFDLTKRFDWWGMFGRGMAQMATGSLQPSQLDLFTTSPTDTQLLQERIEKVLRDSIKKLRPTSRTVWNRYCIVTLRKLLPTLEKLSWQCEQTSVILHEHLQELSHILSSHKMCGFPLNFAYTHIKEIEEAVKGTGVHCYENPDAEFALAVYIHPYPCDILSVWVYVAYLVRRR